jgi:hypothetical protein
MGGDDFSGHPWWLYLSIFIDDFDNDVFGGDMPKEDKASAGASGMGGMGDMDF